MENKLVYVIFGNHGPTAHVGYWNGYTLPQLHTQCQDHNECQRNIMFTLDLDEVQALEHDIFWAQAILQEHSARTREWSAHPFFCCHSMEDYGWLRHLEVSCWQDYVRVSARRYCNNLQAQLCPTKDGIQYNTDQLSLLRRLLLYTRISTQPPCLFNTCLSTSRRQWPSS